MLIQYTVLLLLNATRGSLAEIDRGCVETQKLHQHLSQ